MLTISYSLLNVFLDEGNNLFRFGLRRIELNDLSLRVDEKFGEVPRNHFSCACFWVIELTVVPQIHKNWMGPLSIDLNFLHHWEFDIEVFGSKLFNFFR